jgi:hypothetical protein
MTSEETMKNLRETVRANNKRLKKYQWLIVKTGR